MEVRITVLQVVEGDSKTAATDHPHLSCSCSDAPRSIHDSGDSGQSFLAALQSFLAAQVCRYGGADHGRRPANEAASVGQEDNVYHLVIGRAWKGRGKKMLSFILRNLFELLDRFILTAVSPQGSNCQQQANNDNRSSLSHKVRY